VCERLGQNYVNASNLDEKNCLKGTVHPKIKTMSSFISPHVVPNLYDFMWNEKYIFLNNACFFLHQSTQIYYLSKSIDTPS